MSIAPTIPAQEFADRRSLAAQAAQAAGLDALAAISCVETGIAAIRPGATAGDLARAGLGKQRALGFEMKGVFSALGHGIGLGWDAPWLTPEESTPIVPGMVLCFERTVEQDGYVGDFEETVLVTETGIEMLTNAAARHY